MKTTQQKKPNDPTLSYLAQSVNNQFADRKTVNECLHYGLDIAGGESNPAAVFTPMYVLFNTMTREIREDPGRSIMRRMLKHLVIFDALTGVTSEGLHATMKDAAEYINQWTWEEENDDE